VLLDAHVFLWWATTRGSRLSEQARDLLADASTDALVGAGALYETALPIVTADPAIGQYDVETIW
jgi:PIN domain nuclease of toxin-antitoxin system